MLVTIQKWGNSQGIRIPKKILDDLLFEENEVVEVKEFNGHILIQKTVRKYTDLDEFFEGYTGDYKCSEYDFGEDVGREKSMVEYNPKQGDIVELDFNPTKGHEQRGKRPALIISNEKYYRRTNLLVVCPISNTENEFPLHFKLDERTKTTGAVLTQHIRTIDPEARPILFKESAPMDIIDRVKETINLFMV